MGNDKNSLAERLMYQGKMQWNPMILAGADFTMEELNANREGYMTKGQRQRLDKNRTSNRRLGLFTLIVAPLIIVWAMVDGMYIYDTLASRLGIMCLILLVTGFVGYAAHVRYRNYGADLRKGEVAVIEDQIRKESETTKGGSNYFVIAQKIKFEVTNASYSAYEANQSYRLYYAPHSKTLLSAEPAAEKIKKDAL